MAEKIVRIGGACAGLGDTPLAVTQLVQGGNVDYLIFDFLAEFTMPILARMKADNPDAGYAPDFAGPYLRPNLREIAAQGIKLVTNAGGISPHSCAAAVARVAAEMGLSFRIAVVDGDDLQPRAEQLRAAGIREMFSGKQIPERPITSVNAYLGALPIAAALAKGADIVITGRVVDSALVLGPLMHEFGWAADDYDRLAAGTVAGHLLECGAQVTGGIFTDWRDVPDWANIGYPIAECHADGSAIITKSPGTGGLVSVGSVSEQLLYEIGDPQRYFMPDVTCDFSTVRIETVGPEQGACVGRDRPAADRYLQGGDDARQWLARHGVVPGARHRCRRQGPACRGGGAGPHQADIARHEPRRMAGDQHRDTGRRSLATARGRATPMRAKWCAAWWLSMKTGKRSA